ncbi:MAG: Lrp/AsnC family transcriptional regulator [Gammaproteobacteria bacterium]|nr:Lrp/AsnC family transcriptional regulator [Gammaproteobacteria bacterium]
MDELDARIVNAIQGGFPVTERPFLDAARALHTTEDELLLRLKNMLDDGVATRFGPLFNAEHMGGAFTLCAMSVPPDDFDDVVEQINAHPQVAHNYEREHTMNIWFVLATETPEEIDSTIAEIEEETGYVVHNLPKSKEYCVGFRVNL